MVKEYIHIVLKLGSLALIIAAAGMWAGAGVDTRPKYRDDQTLVGGTIWSQLIMPIGLLLSKIVKEDLNAYVHGYFLLTGVGLCMVTGIVLIFEELKAMSTRLRPIETQLNIASYDRTYLAIGILSLLAGIISLTQLLLLIIL